MAINKMLTTPIGPIVNPLDDAEIIVANNGTLILDFSQGKESVNVSASDISNEMFVKLLRKAVSVRMSKDDPLYQAVIGQMVVE